MSQETVEIVRRLYAAMNSGGLEAVVPFFDSDFEFVPPADWPDSPTLRGVEPIQAMARQWIETFDDFKIEPERFVDPGEDRVLVYVRDKGRIKGSGVEIDNPFIHLWTLKDATITRWQSFTDESQALEAAGLRE